MLRKVAELEIERDANMGVETFMSDIGLLVKEGKRKGGEKFHRTCLKLQLGSHTKYSIIFSSFLQFVVCELKLRAVIYILFTWYSLMGNYAGI